MTEFEASVLEYIKKIPKGKLTTYANIAKAIGHPGAARAVGNALNKNPWAPKVPCHRVVKSNGAIGGYAQGVKTKVKYLGQEGVIVRQGKVVGFKEKLM